MAETAHWIAGKVAMLEPGQVEVAETKITALLGKLDQLAERSSSVTGSPDQDNKVHLFVLSCLFQWNHHNLWPWESVFVLVVNNPFNLFIFVGLSFPFRYYLFY